MRSFRARYFWLLTLGLLVSTGCSGKQDDKDGDTPESPKPTAEVSGTVTLPDGKPLPAGWIAFHGKDASESAVATVADGKFLAKGVPTGDNIRVTVDTGSAGKEAADLKEQMDELLMRIDLMNKAGKTDAARERHKQLTALNARRKQLDTQAKALKGVQVDAKFLLPETTPLKQKIASGTQKLDISLKP
jgi:hypothetical protein